MSYQPPRQLSPSWFERHLPESSAFMRKQPAAAPMLWALAGLILAFVLRKQYPATLGIVLSCVVMASRWAAMFIDALLEHPRYKRRGALRHSLPYLFALAVATASGGGVLLGLLTFPFSISWLVVLSLTTLRGYWIIRSYGGRLPKDF